MNRLHRLVWSPRLHMLVAVAEMARASGKSAAGESSTAPGATSRGTTEGARAWPRALAAIAAASLLAVGAPAWATALPGGSLLDINNGSNGNNGNSYSSGWAHYSIGFRPTATGNNYVLFAFRQDPAFWTFGNVSLTVAGDSTNLFTDPTFASGGSVSPQSGLQAPAGWGIVYQTGTTPHAAGRWQPGFNGDETAGAWYDGAVGSFDGIYQGVSLTAGADYTIGFSLFGNNPASAAGGIEMGVFGGTCVTLTGPAEACVPDNAAFTALATPDETANAGHPATDIDTAADSYAASDVPATVNPVFDGGTLRMDASPTQDFTITGNGGTIDQAGAASSFSGVLADAGDGGGPLTITNSGAGGSVTMTGANTYTGATTIDAGATLALAGAGSIAASSGLQADGTFDISGTDAGASVQTLSGDGNVVLGAQTLRLTAAHDTFGGTIAGSGGLAVAGGTETLSGSSTYTGGTTVTNGATVRIGADANLGAASGGVRLDGGTLQTTASFDSARDLTLGAAGGTVDTASGTTLTDSGAVGGTGSLAKAGDGTLVLTGTLSHTGGTRVDAGTLVLGGDNTYAGGTTVNTGATLQVSADANLGATENNALTLAGGTLRTTGSFTSGRDLAVGAGGGTISTDAGTTLAIDGSIGGTGTLRKTGDGELVLGGVVAGSGGIAVEAGKETLTAASTYTGATSIGTGSTLALAGEGAIAASSGVQADGTFDIAATDGGASVQTLAGTGRVLLGAHDLTLTGAHDTFAGTIAGSGGVAVTGGTETLSGTNSYTGGTTVRDGATLRIADDANLGDASGGVTLDGGTLRATGDLQTARDFTLGAAGGVIGADSSVQASGNISGTGTLTATGPGVVVLTGSASHTGGVHVSGGALGLLGDNSYSGGTTVDAGALLAVRADNNLGATTGNALTLDGGTLLNIASFDTARDVALTANGGTIESVADTVLTVGGAVTGAGPLTKSGDGTLVLSGSNSYAGGTRITGGTLQIGADANLGDASGGVSLDGGTLQATASFTSARDLVLGAAGGTLRTDAGVTLADSGAVSGNGTLTKDGAGTLRLDGALAHTGGTVVNGGTLALSGTNSYSGGTTVRNGATLQIAADANLGATAGNALTLDGGTLETTASFDTARAIALGTNGGTLRTDAGTTLTNATGSITGDGGLLKDGAGTLALGGTLAQSGGVTVQGGTLALSGANTYTGGTRIGNGATLQVTADANLGATSGNALALDGGTLQAGASFATSRDIALGAQGATLDTTAGSTLEASGVISGAAGLAKTGAGTLVLAGANTYTGATQVAGGTLALAGNGSLAASSGVRVDVVLDLAGSGADVALQSVAGSGAVHLGDRGLTLTNAHDAFAGIIDGQGGVSVAGGTQAFTGANSYSGGTTVRGGAVLQVGADANLGAATGTLTLDGGTLQATRGFSSDRDVTVATAGGTLRTDGGTSLTLNGSLSGSGTLVKEGSGTLTLAGDNAGPDHAPGTGWTGGITIGGGLVQVTNEWGLGWGDVNLAGGTINTLVDIRTGQKIAVAPGASIDTAAGTVTTLSGTMTSVGGGNGCFVKSGAGTLNMTGSATLGSGTCVQQGDLRANGTLTSNVSVDAGATLGGAGLIRGSVDVHGTLSPGNSPGYLTVAGDVNMAAGSTFQEDIAGTTQANAATPVGATGYYSYLHVTGNGQFVIDAASTLAPRMKNIFTPAEAGFSAPAYTPALGDSFRIVTADGGIAGRFGTLAQPDGLASGTRFAAFYDVFGSNSIDLVVLPTSYANTLAASNGNTRSIAGALDALAAQDQAGTGTAAQDQLLYMVARQNAAALPAYAQSLAGEVHAAVAAASSQAGLGLSGAVGQQLRRAADTSTDAQAHSALWLDAQGRHARWSGDEAGSGFTTNGSQFTLGADVYRRGTTRLGVGFSHASTRIGADQGSAGVDENFAFAYGQRSAGRFVVDALAAYGHSQADTQRADPTGLSATALASASKGRSALLAAGVRAPWKVDGATVAPFARVTVQKVTRDAATEGAGSPAALGLGRFSATGTRLVAGLSGTSAQADPLQAPATWNYSAGLGFDAGALSRPTVQADLAGVATQISAPHVGRVFLQLDAAGTMRLRPNAYVYYGVTGEARSGAVGVGVNAGLRVSF